MSHAAAALARIAERNCQMPKILQFQYLKFPST
jgi:hypothetical protein